jgi:hypothetical protein
MIIKGGFAGKRCSRGREMEGIFQMVEVPNRTS